MAAPKERTDVKISQERAVLAAVHLPGSKFDPRDPLGELRELAQTAGATVVGELVQNRHIPESGTYIGRGKLEELKAMCDELQAGLVIFDHELSPKQIAGIEEAIGRKVLDRSELILDIFASRATTHEARLQVELAQLEYTYARLRAMWDHLERIVGHGGIGGIGTRGPGEQQLEIDRRIVQRKAMMLKREIADIQERKAREVRERNADHFTVGLVGYTNAGKSTLFNALTAGGAFANDQLFATLMTRTREWRVGSGAGGPGGTLSVMLSDTVGFVRDLPTNLVASFKATLEEATHANLLLIVLDVSDPAAELQYETVINTLEELVAGVRKAEERAGREYAPPERIVLLNKSDRLRNNAELLVWQTRVRGAIPFCALTPGGMGHSELESRVRTLAAGEDRELLLTLPLSQAKAIHNIETQAKVLDRVYEDSKVTLRVVIGERQLVRLRAAGASIQARTPDGREALPKPAASW